MPPTRTFSPLFPPARRVRLAGLTMSGSLLAATAAMAGAGHDHALHCPPVAAKPAPMRLAQASTQASSKPAPSAKEVAQEVADLLQSCSYDGSPIKVDSGALAFSSQGDAKAVVTNIMKFTGLPQNFEIVEGQVPNAAALILVSKQDRTPKRVIAYNPKFMEMVRTATQNSDWASISIMAHEIGHHLSGHTLLPGGSQPPIELEADKFSGFVLHRMGAGLPDALKAMNALVKDGPDGPTHPGRGRRVAAITSGWTEACEQAGRSDCAAPARMASAPASTPSPAPAPAPSPSPASPPAAKASAPSAAASTPAEAPPPPARAASDRKSVAAVSPPKPDKDATPSKFSRFVYDEYGVLDAATVETFETQLYDHARDTGVEIVTLIVKDFHGLEPDDYALAMMRQLRVGKLDVGNGAVFAIAPEQGKTGVALGPGVMGRVKGQIGNYRKSADALDASSLELCREKGCGGPITENVLYWPDHVRRDTRPLEWTVRYPNFEELFAVYKSEFDAMTKGGRYDPAKSLVFRKIARLEATLETADLAAGDKQVNAAILRDGYQAMRGKGPGGEILNLYVLPSTKSLQPVAALEPGRRYSFVARQLSLSTNVKDAQSFEVLSYSLLQ